jgi:hypothetical protein
VGVTTIDAGLQRDLVSALSAVPAAATYAGRSTFLSGITVSLDRDEGNHWVDLTNIVRQLVAAEPDGCLLVELIKNAEPLVAQTTTGRTLRDLRARVEQARAREAGANGRARHGYELAMLHQFDMQKLVTECINVVLTSPPGLLGLAVACDSSALLRALEDRLLDDLRGDAPLESRLPLRINPSHRPAEAVVRIITEKYAGRLRSADLLLRVEAAEWATAAAFWEKAKERFAGRLTRRLIVLLAVPPGGGPPACPAGVTLLPEPAISFADMYTWVRRVLDANGWPPGDAQRLALAMFKACGPGSATFLDDVYAYLDDVLAGLRLAPTYEAFLTRLELEGAVHAPTPG